MPYSEEFIQRWKATLVNDVPESPVEANDIAFDALQEFAKIVKIVAKQIEDTRLRVEVDMENLEWLYRESVKYLKASEEGKIEIEEVLVGALEDVKITEKPEQEYVGYYSEEDNENLR